MKKSSFLFFGTSDHRAHLTQRNNEPLTPQSTIMNKLHTTAILVLIVSVILTGCNKKKTSVNAEGIEQIYINNPLQIPLEELISEYDIIRLEATEQSLLSDIGLLQIMNDKIYVTDGSMSKVLIYTLDGKYISQINDQGQGPKEYIRIYSIEADHVNKRLFLTDTFSKRLFIYDEDGNLQQVVPMKFMPGRIMSDGKGHLLHHKAAIEYYDKDKDLNKSHLQILNNKGEITGSLLPDETQILKRFRPMQGSNLTTEGDLLFMPHFSNIIYRIHNLQATPRYEVIPQNGWELLSTEDKKQIYYTVEKSNVEEYEQQKKMIFTGTFLHSDSLLFVSSGWEKHFYTFYSIQTGKSFTIDPQEIKGNEGLRAIFSTCPKTLYKEYFYISIPFSYMGYSLQYLEEGKLKTSFESIMENEGNPCLIRYKLNEKLFQQ